MESELDERMTDEAKTFVSNNLKAMRPLEMIKADINTVRAARITNAQRINGALTFENLTISKFIVKNPSDGYEIEVTCYKPVDAKESAPITVYFHGGGWTFNSVSVYDASVSSLAANSKTVWLSVEYRLSPENKYPTPLNDCIEVVKYVHANKEQFSSRSAKVGVSGDSSGGHFAALVSLDYSDLVDFQILIYPSLYLGILNASIIVITIF
jgi:acetyl esterase/lipase